MARVAVVGVGAIGGVLAGLLQTAGHEIVLCTRRPLARLTVETPEGLVVVDGANLIPDDPKDATPVDWVLVATKTYDAAGAKLWLQKLCGAGTSIAVVQNGAEHRENFAPEWTVLPVVIDVPAERRPDGSVLQRSFATLKVEASDPGRAFAKLFEGTTAQVEVTDDFLSAVWRKLCINAVGVISGLTGKPAGVLRQEALGPFALGIAAECVAVGRAVGARLEDEIGETILANARKGSPDSVNSLLADRLAGRATEIDARNGVIVRLGAKHGIATPLNQAAVALFKAMVG